MSEIKYVICVPESEDHTKFQGFSRAVTSYEFLRLLDLINFCPNRIDEIFMSQSELCRSRSQGGIKDVSCIDKKWLPFFMEENSRGTLSFVILCVAADLSDVKNHCESIDACKIIISGADDPSVIDWRSNQVPFITMLDEALHAILLSRIGDAQIPGWMKSPLRNWPAEKLSIPSRISGVTRPNELLVMGLGFQFCGDEKILSGNSEEYENAIVSSVELALQKLNREDASDFILYTPAIYSAYYDFKTSRWNSILRHVNSDQKNFIKNGIFRNKHYSGFSTQSHGGIFVKNPYEEKILGDVLRERQSELKTTSFGIAQFSSSHSMPAIRLPNSINLNGPLLKELEGYINSTREVDRKKIQQTFRKYQNIISDAIPIKFKEIIADKAENIAICSDAPIEWTPVEDVPLLVRNNTFRIPMTPGNLFLELTMLGHEKIISSKSLTNILIIRSFSEKDPIKHVLEKGISVLKFRGEMNITIKDVDTVQETINVLNSNNSSIVIFDCHGSHGGNEDVGWLNIGQERLNSWELAHIARVPPIVLLSACSTLPLAGSHVSVVNGFIRSGAITVLGSFVPIDAIASAVFISRILVRLDGFLPAIANLGFESVTWLQFMSGFMRMSYCTDILKFCRREFSSFSADDEREIGFKSNMDINPINPEWFNNLVCRISEKVNLPAKNIVALIRTKAALTDTLMYCQVGRPDLININLEKT